MNGGYIQFHEIQTKKEREFICKICPVPIKFSKNSNLKQQNGRNDQIIYGKNVRMLSKEVVCNQESKVATCEICLEVLSCKQNLNMHLKDVHQREETFPCKKCDKTFKSRDQLRRSYVRAQSITIELTSVWKKGKI